MDDLEIRKLLISQINRYNKMDILCIAEAEGEGLGDELINFGLSNLKRDQLVIIHVRLSVDCVMKSEEL